VGACCRRFRQPFPPPSLLFSGHRPGPDRVRPRGHRPQPGRGRRRQADRFRRRVARQRHPAAARPPAARRRRGGGEVYDLARPSGPVQRVSGRLPQLGLAAVPGGRGERGEEERTQEKKSNPTVHRPLSLLFRCCSARRAAPKPPTPPSPASWSTRTRTSRARRRANRSSRASTSRTRSSPPTPRRTCRATAGRAWGCPRWRRPSLRRAPSLWSSPRASSRKATPASTPASPGWPSTRPLSPSRPRWPRTKLWASTSTPTSSSCRPSGPRSTRKGSTCRWEDTEEG